MVGTRGWARFARSPLLLRPMPTRDSNRPNQIPHFLTPPQSSYGLVDMTAASPPALRRPPGARRYTPIGKRTPSLARPVSPSPKHPPTDKHQPAPRGGSVSSLPPYEALFQASGQVEGLVSPREEDANSQLPPVDLAAADNTTPSSYSTDPLSSSLSSLDDTELELDDSILLDRLVLRSSIALATAQSLLAGTLSTRGAVLDWHAQEGEGAEGLKRIETETRLRSVPSSFHAPSSSGCADSFTLQQDASKRRAIRLTRPPVRLALHYPCHRSRSHLLHAEILHPQ